MIIAITLLFAADGRAQDVATSENPYAGIVSRNIFGLLPIPTNNPDQGPPAEPPPKITPNGIMTIFGKLQALFKVASKAKPGQPAKDDSYVLAEGERQDEIEVVKINQADGIVTFDNHGTVQELPLVAANPTTPGTAPGGVMPAGRGFKPAINPRPAAMPAALRGGAPGMNMNAGNPGIGANASGPDAGGNNLQPSGSQPPNNIEDQVMNAAREMAIIEQNRIDTQPLVDQGLMPPLPPTLLTPPDARAADGSPLIVPSTSPVLPPASGH